MSPSLVVIFAGRGVTAAIQEKCNLGNIQWLNLEETSTEPCELNPRHVLFILNNPLLSFLRKRRNHKWLGFLEGIADPSKVSTVNDLNKGSVTHQGSKPAVIFTELTDEEIEDGKEIFLGIEQLQVSPGNGLETLVMQRLALMSDTQSQGAAALNTHPTTVVHTQGATVPIHTQGATVPIHTQGATVPIHGHSAITPVQRQSATPTHCQSGTGPSHTQSVTGAHPFASPGDTAWSHHQGANSVTPHPGYFFVHGNGPSISWQAPTQQDPVHCTPQSGALPSRQPNAGLLNGGVSQSMGAPGWLSPPDFSENCIMTSYVMGYPSGLDADRSLSSQGLDLGQAQSVRVPPGGPSPSNTSGPSQRYSPGLAVEGANVAYFHQAVSELSINGGSSGQVRTGQGDHQDRNPCLPTGYDQTGHRCGLQQATPDWPPQDSRPAEIHHCQPFNIAPDKSIEANNSSGDPSLASLPYSRISGEGGASHVDPKPAGHGTGGDKTSGNCGDDVLMVDLPVDVIQYLSSELDIDRMYGKNWTHLAALRGYVYSRVLRILGNRSIGSPFLYLLGQQEFSGYTYGEFKKDLQVLPRIDVLKRLQEGNYI